MGLYRTIMQVMFARLYVRMADGCYSLFIKVGWVNINLETIIAIIIWLFKDTTFAQAKIIIANTKGCIYIIFPFP